MDHARILYAFFTMLCAAAASTAQQSVVVPCDRDNTLYESTSGAFSNALGESIFVGVTAQNTVRRALLHFDVASALPSGARIVAATLHLEVVTSGATAPATAGLHRVVADWGEGTSYALTGGGGQGAPSTVGDATWTRRFHPSTPWASAGGDYQAGPSATFSLPIAGAAVCGPTQALTADVQSWLDQPATNFGWLIKAAVETVTAARARRIHSREAPGAVPALVVHYLLPGETGSWGVGCAVGTGTFAFAFVGPMVGGTTVQLAHTNGPPLSLAVNYFALGLDPAGVPLLPGCALHLPAALEWIPGNLVALDAAGAGSSPWPVPAAYPGLFFVSQSAALANTPLGLVVSNTGVAVLQ
ncbi:MAG: DNRLRE domain-containing protein [Planctomycetes bacterium]|nr:DNRLRE domain-containing protein [Planctomycetota bacterium]